MSRGKPWTSADTATLQRMQGRPDREIAEAIGFSVMTIRKRRRDLGLKAFQGRSDWTRKDWLMADAAGLDFQISL